MRPVPLWRIVSADASVDAGEAKRRVEAFAASVRAGLDAGRFELKGFGQLVPQERPARVGRNPQTGEAIQIPARRTVSFRAAIGLKRALAGEEPSVKSPDSLLQVTAGSLVRALAGAEGEMAVKVDGVGVFRKALRKERVGRNPQTREPIRIPATATVTFKPERMLAGGDAADASGEGPDEAEEAT